MLDKLKTAMVLVIIAGLSGLLIYFVNENTYEQIAENARIKEENYYKEIFDIDKDVELSPEKTALEGTINQMVLVKGIDGTVYGTIYRGENKNSFGPVTVLVGVNDDNTIAQVIISGTDNTPNYVKLITKSIDGNPSYMDRFSGQSLDDVLFDTDAGASFSYGSVRLIVEKVIESVGETNE